MSGAALPSRLYFQLEYLSSVPANKTGHQAVLFCVFYSVSSSQLKQDLLHLN